MVKYAETKERLVINENGIPQYNNDIPLEVEFVDQTLGSIQARKWNFGDGNIENVNTHPYDHIIRHTYTEPGIYWPQLQVLDQNDTLRLYSFRQPIVVGLSTVIGIKELVLGASSSDEKFLSRHVSNFSNHMKNRLLELENSVIIK